MGAKTRTIIFKVLLPESMPALISGITVTAIALVGYTAMAGIIGAGGLGTLAYMDGFQRSREDVTLVCDNSYFNYCFHHPVHRGYCGEEIGQAVMKYREYQAMPVNYNNIIEKGSYYYEEDFIRNFIGSTCTCTSGMRNKK